MELLDWQQDAEGLHVRVMGPNGAQCSFSIDNSLINYLLAGTPRMYHIFLQMSGAAQEECYVLDLTALRPVIQKTNALRMSVGRRVSTTVRRDGTVVGRYCLARGESYHDRFLAQNGWVGQRLYQDVYLDGTQQSIPVSAPVSAPQQSAQTVGESFVSAQTAPEPEQPVQKPAPQQPAEDDFDLDLTL